MTDTQQAEAQKVIEGMPPEVIAALNSYREQFTSVRAIARKAARSGNPGLRQAGEDILAVLA